MSNWTEKEMKKKKGSKALGLCKKPVDIESEFIGIASSPKKPKEKKSDTTKDLEELLKQPMSIELIKEILLRIEGRWICDKPGTSTIKIYATTDSEFIIKIKKIKYFDHRYILDCGGLYSLRSFFNGHKELDTSDLKKLVRFKMHEWLCDNLDKLTLIK